MRRSKRMLSLLLAAMLIVSVLAACSNNMEEEPSVSATPAPESSDAPEPATERVTLKIEVFDRGNTPPGGGPPDNNYWTQWIQKDFGDPNNITVEFIPVPRNQEVDKLNVLMAAGDAPDIVFSGNLNLVHNYVKSGGLTELTELIDEYGPNLKKMLGEEVLSYGIFQGQQFAINSKLALRPVLGAVIRKDWLDALNLPVPTTTDEFYNALKLFKEKDPGQTGGKVIPLGMPALTGTTTSPANLMNSFIESMPEEDFYALPLILQPGYKEGVRFMNKLYTEGLISRDFALDKDMKKFESDIVNGYVGVFNHAPNNWIIFGPVLEAMKANNPNAEYVAMNAYTNYEGKHPKRINFPVGQYNMIPKTSKRAVEAIKYLDWLSRPEVLFTIQNGIEGQHHTIVNGIPIPINSDEVNKIMYNKYEYTNLIVGGLDYGSLEKNIEAAASQQPEFLQELIKNNIMYSLDEGWTYPRFDRPVESEIKYGSTLTDKANETILTSILSKPEEFDRIYDAGIVEYLKIGGQEVIDEKRAIYKEMKK